MPASDVHSYRTIPYGAKTVDDTDSTPAAPRPRTNAPWTFSRLLALAAGAVILIWITRWTFGLALVPLLGILIAVKVQRGRGKRLSMFGSWLASAGAAAIAFAVISAFAYSRLPPGSLTKTLDSVMVAQQNAPQPKLPPILERMQRDDSVSRAARAQGEKLARDPKFLGTMMVFGMVMGSAIVASILGTVSWTSGLLLARGYTGEWPFRKELEPETY